MNNFINKFVSPIAFCALLIAGAAFSKVNVLGAAGNVVFSGISVAHAGGNDYSNQNQNQNHNSDNNDSNKNDHNQDQNQNHDNGNGHDGDNNHGGQGGDGDNGNGNGNGNGGNTDFGITKTVDNATPHEGDTIHYTVTVSNLGTASTTGVSVSDQLPSGLTFVSATTTKGSYSNGSGSWNVGTMSASSTATLVITAKVQSGTAGKTIKNTASIDSASCGDQNSSNDAASVSITVAANAPTPTLGSITVCKVTLNASGTIVNGSAFSGQTFTVPGISQIPSTTAAAAGTLSTSAFSTPLSLNTKLFGSSTNNAQCVTYSNLPIGHYYYGQEVIASSSNQWAAPVYNDQDTVTASSLSNFFAYSGELFDASSSNDGNRNTNADGDINLLASRPDRQLIVLNKFMGTTPTSTPTSTVPTADIAIAKTANVTSTNEGGTINYTLIVSANGPTTSTGVTATDVLPSGLTLVSATSSKGTYATTTGVWTIGTMAPSSTATLTIAATANAGTAGTTISNTAIVGENSSTTDQNPGNNSSTVPVVINPTGCTSNCGGGGGTTPSADISVAKTADVTSTTEGGTIHYTITVKALGPSTSTGVVATDTLPAGLTFVSATASIGSYASSTGTWTIGNMSVSSTATLAITATANTGTAGTTIRNTAIVGENSSSTDNNHGNNSSTIPVTITTTGGGGGGNTADLSIVKTVDNANPSEGATITYTVTVTDLGPQMAQIVLAHDVLPNTLSFASATSSTGTYNITSGNWTIGTLQPNATATLTLSAVVNGGTAGTTISNTATVSQLSSIVDSPANNSSTVSFTVAANPCTTNCGGGGGGGGGGSTPTAEIGVVKTVDNATPNAGDTIHYTVTVSAIGPSLSIGSMANDLLPTGVTFVSATSSQGTYVPSTGVWTIGDLVNGHQATLVITATVNAGTNGQTIANTATIHESTNVIDPLSGNNSSTVTITVLGNGGGGGGGGGTTVGVGGGGGGSTGLGQVLGTSTVASCGLYLNDFIHPIRQYLNNPAEVKKLQVFLNQNLGTSLPITGYYGPMTISAVNQFQVKYHIEILAPWLPYGLATEMTPTSYVYKTTQRWINLIMCPALNLTVPQLP